MTIVVPLLDAVVVLVVTVLKLTMDPAMLPPADAICMSAIVAIAETVVLSVVSVLQPIVLPGMLPTITGVIRQSWRRGSSARAGQDDEIDQNTHRSTPLVIGGRCHAVPE